MPYCAIFPGQGSQSTSMAAAFADTEQMRDAIQCASDALGMDMNAVISSEEKMAMTAYVQPALLTCSVGIYECYKTKEGAPVAVTGHSLGEFSALVAAGAISLEQAVALVHQRGKLMQEAVPSGEGAMVAVLGLDLEKVTAFVEGREDIWLANINAPTQIVLAGSSEAVDLALAPLKEAGAKRCVKLPVSVPSHCPLMQPAAEKFAAELKQISWQNPAIPVIQNTTGETAKDLNELVELLERQLVFPVRWTQCLQSITSRYPGAQLVEAGPGRVLSGLVRQFDRKLQCTAAGVDTDWLEGTES